MKPKPEVRALSSGPIIPTSWTVPAWFVDPSNASGVASDSNACTSSGAPCLTWHQINDVRWGCQGTPSACPRLRQATTVTWLSNQSGNGDPVYTKPGIEAGATYAHVAPLGTSQQVATGTTASCAGGSGTRSGNAMLNCTLPAGLAVGQLVKNTTHPSFAWIVSNVAGNTWNLSQPLAAFTVPSAYFSIPPEVAWSNGDAVTVYAPIAVDFVDFEPIVTDLPTSTSSYPAAFVQHISVLSPTNFGPNFTIGTAVGLSETSSARTIAYSSPSSESPSILLENVFTTNAALVEPGSWQGNDGTGQLAVYAGAFEGGGTFANAILTGDAILFGSNIGYVLTGPNSEIELLFAGNVASTEIAITGSALALNAGFYAGGPKIWGAGKLVTLGTGRLSYPSGAGNAAATLLTSGTLLANGLNKGCVLVPSAASAFGTCNLTLSAAQLDTSLGATVGCLVGTGGMFCNTGTF